MRTPRQAEQFRRFSTKGRLAAASTTLRQVSISMLEFYPKNICLKVSQMAAVLYQLSQKLSVRTKE